MTAVTGQFLYDIGTSLQSGNSKTAIGGRLIGSDDRAAGAGGSCQVLDLKHRVFDGLAGDRVILVDHQSAQRCVLKGESLTFAGLDEHFLGGRLLNGVTRHRFDFRDFVPAILQIGELELAGFIGVEASQIIDLTAFGFIAGVGDMELCAL